MIHILIFYVFCTTYSSYYLLLLIFFQIISKADLTPIEGKKSKKQVVVSYEQAVDSYGVIFKDGYACRKSVPAEKEIISAKLTAAQKVRPLYCIL